MAEFGKVFQYGEGDKSLYENHERNIENAKKVFVSYFGKERGNSFCSILDHLNYVYIGDSVREKVRECQKAAAEIISEDYSLDDKHKRLLLKPVYLTWSDDKALANIFFDYIDAVFPQVDIKCAQDKEVLLRLLSGEAVSELNIKDVAEIFGTRSYRSVYQRLSEIHEGFEDFAKVYLQFKNKMTEDVINDVMNSKWADFLLDNFDPNNVLDIIRSVVDMCYGHYGDIMSQYALDLAKDEGDMSEYLFFKGNNAQSFFKQLIMAASVKMYRDPETMDTVAKSGFDDHSETTACTLSEIYAQWLANNCVKRMKAMGLPPAGVDKKENGYSTCLLDLFEDFFEKNRDVLDDAFLGYNIDAATKRFGGDFMTLDSWVENFFALGDELNQEKIDKIRRLAENYEKNGVSLDSLFKSGVDSLDNSTLACMLVGIKRKIAEMSEKEDNK